MHKNQNQQPCGFTTAELQVSLSEVVVYDANALWLPRGAIGICDVRCLSASRRVDHASFEFHGARDRDRTSCNTHSCCFLFFLENTANTILILVQLWMGHNTDNLVKLHSCLR